MSDRMVVMNCGSQGMRKYAYKPGTRILLEEKIFPPKTPVECSREMGEALLKKYNNPNMKIFFRNPADPEHEIDIKNLAYAGLPSSIRRSLLSKIDKQKGQNNDISRVAEKPRRKYVKRKK